jgi:flagellar motility protein MotE (MotC chaperone)
MNDYKQFFKAAQKAKDGERPRPMARPTPQLKVRKSSTPPTVESLLAIRKKKKAPFPWRAVTTMSLILAGLGFYLAAPEYCESLYSRIEVSAFGAATAAEKSQPKAEAKEKPASEKPAETKAKNPDDTHTSAEDLSHFDKLKQRKEELDLREKELSQLEEELQRQKVELDKRIQQLEDMRSQIAQVLKDRVEVDQEKVNKLVDLYSNMKPKQAAEILGTINEDLAVEVLAKMKKKSAAEIMNLLPSDKAKVLSEKYTGYRRVKGQDPKG